MAKNYGKDFERKLKEDFLKIKDSTIDRLYDSMSGYKTISNISDFIGFKVPNIFYIEAKSIRGNTFPFSNLSQYWQLTKKVGIPGVRVGVVIWFIDHGRVLYVPISTITQMKKDGKKSVNIKTVLDEYNVYELPSVKKRIFCDTDYSILLTLKDGE